MTTMLDQAIIDAQLLREAAIQNAEAAIVEKYASEVKEAVSQILEQDDDPAELGDDEPASDSTAMEQVPMAHMSEEGEQEIVEVDLDDIIAAAEADIDDDEEEFELDRAEIADEVGLDLDMEDDAPPANRDDELEITEDELVSVFKEMLTVDVSPEEMEVTIDELEEEEEDKEDLTEVLRLIRR